MKGMYEVCDEREGLHGRLSIDQQTWLNSCMKTNELKMTVLLVSLSTPNSCSPKPTATSNTVS